MKYLKLLTKTITVILLLIATTINAQDLPGFNYQAVARDASGNLIAKTEISVIIQIALNESNVVWEEKHVLTTNIKGMFSIAVGTDKSAIISQEVESLAQLNWKDEDYQLNIIVNDTDMGSSPILSVPIAMYGEDEDADPNNEIQELKLSDGNLEISKGSTSVNLSAFLASELTAGAVGVGTDSPEGVMDVQGSLDGDKPIFQVKNNNGIPVFAVYNEGVRVYIPEELSATKGIKGGFAVGGYNSSKALDTDDYFMQIMPQGTNINFFTDNNTKNESKGIKGGFAVGGYNSSKSESSSFVYMDPFATTYTTINGIQIFLLRDYLYPKGNCYLGTLAGANHKGHFNTAIGYQSSYSNKTYWQIGTSFYNNASRNTTLGSFSGFLNELGDNNVYLGYKSGASNQGTGNIFLGYKSGENITEVSNKLIIDNSNTTEPLIYGDFESNDIIINGSLLATGPITQNSDLRLKTNIHAIKNAMNIVQNINGVSYNWNTELRPNASTKNQIGVIAQDVEKVLPELVFDNQDGYKSVSYAKLTAVLIEAVKEQQIMIEEQQKEINELRSLGNLSSEDMLKLMSEMQETIVELTEKVTAMEQFAATD